VTTLSFAAFRRHFWDRQRPLLLRNAVTPTVRAQWTWEALAVRFQGESFQLAHYTALDKAPKTTNISLNGFLAKAEWATATQYTLNEQLQRGSLDVLCEARWDHSPVVHSAFMSLKAQVFAV
jgi:ribosomal protein L16 Arg81 hydroxylase